MILCLCPTENCEVSTAANRSIKTHLKNCKKISQNKKRNANRKVYCHKTFLKKSNRDRQVKKFYENSNNTTCENIIDLNVNDGEIDEEFPTMVSIGLNNVEFNANEVSPAMNQSIHSETTSEQLFMEGTSTITGEDVFRNSLPTSPVKSSSQIENFLILASPMKSPEKSRNLENVLEKIKKLKNDDAFE